MSSFLEEIQEIVDEHKEELPTHFVLKMMNKCKDEFDNSKIPAILECVKTKIPCVDCDELELVATHKKTRIYLTRKLFDKIKQIIKCNHRTMTADVLYGSIEDEKLSEELEDMLRQQYNYKGCFCNTSRQIYVFTKISKA
jgi:hypothetical protein